MDEAPHPTQHDEFPRHVPEMARSDSSSASSVGESSIPQIVAPVPVRPRLPSRKSSGTIIVPRDSVDAVEPAETWLDPGDVRAMSPRRTTEDLENLGREARDELRRHAKALQDSLIAIFNRIEAVKEEHDKLDSNNKFLQKYIGDLMSTSKITAPSSRGKK
ncbi:putative bZIP transcription factor [Coniella lustricola]|uniref:Putative bZIP transcription factor n=1 Tax=Coniella lustricola TaxID=2025994 RepID=A0A2T2ZSX2_9PEZI|nr:putative bZIP transcription factor [Coniella lustricola]